MSKPARIALGFIALSWVALVVALVAIPLTPHSFCNEVPLPTGWLTTFWALVTGAVAAFVAMGFAAFGERNLRASLVVCGLALMPLFAISPVGLFWSHHVVSMTDCG
jgi:drug/metabolite transporter (DMT)-like permease